MNAPDGMSVDHINHDGLDNRKVNLRLCNAAQNSRNRKPTKNSSSKFVGVNYRKDHKTWTAQIVIDGKNHFCGEVKNEQKAAFLRDAVAIKLGDSFNTINFPELMFWTAI
jgi:hypothetical protein